MTTNNLLLSVQSMLGNKESARTLVIERLTHEAYLILRDGNSHNMRETADALSTAKGNGKVFAGFFNAFMADVAKLRNGKYKSLKKADVTEAIDKAINAFIAKGVKALFAGYDTALQDKKDKAAATRAANKADQTAPTTEASATDASASQPDNVKPLQATVNAATLPKGWNATVNKAGTVTGFIINGFEVSLKSIGDHAKAMQAALAAAEQLQKAA
jgi:hypothetical protein